MEEIVLMMEVFRKYGIQSLIAGLMWLMWHKGDKLNNKVNYLMRLLARRNENVSREDIKNHRYFSEMDKHLQSTRFTPVEKGGTPLDFKMYVADVVSFINHDLYKTTLQKYLMSNRFSNIDKDIPLLLKGFSNDSDYVVEKCLGPDIAVIYLKQTASLRDIYFDTINAMLSCRKMSGHQKAFLLLDLLERRIATSHNILYKMFLEMNGKMDALADKTPILTKEAVETMLKPYKQLL